MLLIFFHSLQAVEKSPKREESPANCFLSSDEDVLELEDDFSDMEDFGFEVIVKAGLL